MQQKKKDKNVEVISLEKEESEESLGSLEEAQIAEFENSQEFELLKVKNENESLKEKEGALKSAVKESTEKVIEEKKLNGELLKESKANAKKIGKLSFIMKVKMEELSKLMDTGPKLRNPSKYFCLKNSVKNFYFTFPSLFVLVLFFMLSKNIIVLLKIDWTAQMPSLIL